MKKLIFSIFLACLALSSAQGGQEYGDGLRAVSRGEWANAVQYFTAACYNYNDNEAGSCKELGVIYEYGKGGAGSQRVKKNDALSKQAYAQCCKKSGGLMRECCKKVGK